MNYLFNCNVMTFEKVTQLIFMWFLQYCVLSPVKWSDLRKSKSMDPDLHHLHRSPAGGGYQSELLSSGLLSCSSSLSSFSDAGTNLKILSAFLLLCFTLCGGQKLCSNIV